VIIAAFVFLFLAFLDSPAFDRWQFINDSLRPTDK